MVLFCTVIILYLDHLHQYGIQFTLCLLARVFVYVESVSQRLVDFLKCLLFLSLQSSHSFLDIQVCLMVLRCIFHQPLEFSDGFRYCISKGFVALCCQHGSGIASLMSLVCCLFVVVNLALYSLWLSSCNTRCIGVSTISVLLFIALQSCIDSIQCLLLCLDSSQSGLIGGHVGSLSSGSLVNSLYLCSKLTTYGALPHLVLHVCLVCPFSVIHQKLEPVGYLGSLIGEFCCLFVAFHNFVDGIAQLTLQYQSGGIEVIHERQLWISNNEFFSFLGG